MGRDLLQVVRDQIERFNEGDASSVSDDDFTEDLVVISPEGWPEGPRVEGLEAWRAQLERLTADWEDARVEFDEMREVAPGRVFALVRYITRGRGGAIGFETPMGVAYFFEGDAIKRVHYCWNPAEALALAEAEEPPAD